MLCICNFEAVDFLTGTACAQALALLAVRAGSLQWRRRLLRDLWFLTVLLPPGRDYILALLIECLQGVGITRDRLTNGTRGMRSRSTIKRPTTMKQNTKTKT